jgi:hypothetical protein
MANQGYAYIFGEDVAAVDDLIPTPAEGDSSGIFKSAVV